jgi:DNA polymerase I
MKKYLIIDTSYLAYRSFFAYPRLQNDNKVDTGAIFGFAKTMLQLAIKIGPDVIVFAKDTKEPTFRHEELTTYKANRPPMENTMVSQLSLIDEFSKNVTANNFAMVGYEADDIIFSVVNQYSREDVEFYVYSGDRDLYQLFVYPHVVFVKEERELVTMFTQDDFRTKYELEPNQWVDYKALVGDSGDNFKGLDGVGPVTAVKLLHACGSLYNLANALGLDSTPFRLIDIGDKGVVQEFITNPKNKSLIDKVINQYDDLCLSYKLSKLAMCNYSENALAESFDFSKTVPLLEELQMMTLVKYYNNNFGNYLKQEELF